MKMESFIAGAEEEGGKRRCVDDSLVSRELFPVLISGQLTASFLSFSFPFTTKISCHRGQFAAVIVGPDHP